MELFSPELERLAAGRAAIMMEQLETLNAYLPGGDWSVDLETRMFRKGDADLKVGLLGSYAVHDASFLWSWGNPGFGTGHVAVEPVLRLTDIGRIWEVPELTVDKLDLSPHADPVQAAERLVMAATGLLECRGYLGLPYEGGKFYVVFDDERVPAGRFDPVSAPRRLSLAMRSFPADHRLTTTRYLDHHQIAYSDTFEGLMVDLGDGSTARVDFTVDGTYAGWRATLNA